MENKYEEVEKHGNKGRTTEKKGEGERKEKKAKKKTKK